MKKLGNQVRLSVLIVDDHDTIISGLRYELKEKYENAQISIAENMQDAINNIMTNDFDIAIVDISFRDEDNSDGIELCRKARIAKPKIKLISYSTYVIKMHYLKQLQEIGVEAIVSKTDGNFAVKHAIDEILLGNIPFLSYEVNNVLIQNKIRKNKDLIKISPREKDLLKLIHQYPYLTYKELADKLSKSQSTIDTHAKNLFKKFKVHSKSELIEKTRNAF